MSSSRTFRHDAFSVLSLTRLLACRIRPTAGEILLDPLFWSPSKSLHFLCDASDRFEIMEREAQVVLDLEASAKQVVGSDWLRNGLDRNLVDNLGKYRKYDGGSVRDLMRVLRNKVRLRSVCHMPRRSVAERARSRRNTITRICQKMSGRALGNRRPVFYRTSRSASQSCFSACTLWSRTISLTRGCSRLTSLLMTAEPDRVPASLGPL